MTCGAWHPEFGVPCLVNVGHRCPHQVYYRDRMYEWLGGMIQFCPEVKSLNGNGACGSDNQARR